MRNQLRKVCVINNYTNFNGYFHRFISINDSVSAIVEREDGTIYAAGIYEIRFIDNEEKFIYNHELSCRILNILKTNEDELGIKYYWGSGKWNIDGMSKKVFLKCRSAGIKSFRELDEICEEKGIKLNP